LEVDTIGYTDSAGFKQGTYTTYLQGKVWKIERYKDDQLHGQHFEYLANGEVLRTDYVNGVRNGYFLHYNPDSIFGKFVTFWQDGRKLWSAFPWELNSYLVPVKGFLSELDSVEIKVPYNSGQLMYTGLIATRGGGRAEPIGHHVAFYESGSVKASIDYDADSIRIFSREGELIKSETISSWQGQRID